MSKRVIRTDAAPQAIGPYSQAIAHKGMVFVSGQIPLDPGSMEMVGGGIESQISQVFENISALCQAAGGSLANIVKLTVYLTNMENFPLVNTIMSQYFSSPFPARAAVGVAALPKGAEIEMDAILIV